MAAKTETDVENPIQQAGGEMSDRITLIIPSFHVAALELHRQRMWDKGYRLESSISEQAFFESDSKSVASLFDGKPIFVATFVRRSATE